MSRIIPEFLDNINSKGNRKEKEAAKFSKKKVIPIVFEDSDDDEEISENQNPSNCKVVKIQRSGGKITVDCDVYIGRRCTMGGWNLSESKWHNPFKVTEKNTIYQVLDDYRCYVKGTDNLMNSLFELKGKILGCWCKKKGHEHCHGDVLVELLNEQIIEMNKKKFKKDKN